MSGMEPADRTGSDKSEEILENQRTWLRSHRNLYASGQPTSPTTRRVHPTSIALQAAADRPRSQIETDV